MVWISAFTRSAQAVTMAGALAGLVFDRIAGALTSP